MAASRWHKCGTWVRQHLFCLCLRRKTHRQVQSVTIAVSTSDFKDANIPKIAGRNGSTGPSNRYDTSEEAQGSRVICAASSLRQLSGTPATYKSTIIPAALPPRPLERLESHTERQSLLVGNDESVKRLSITFSENSIHSQEADDSEKCTVRSGCFRDMRAKCDGDPWEVVPRTAPLALLIQPQTNEGSVGRSDSLDIRLSCISYEGESGTSERELFREMTEGMEKKDSAAETWQ